MTGKLTIADFPLAETAHQRIEAAMIMGKPTSRFDAVTTGAAKIEDLRITAAALRAQAEIAHPARRTLLAQNFERGAELVAVPHDLIMAARGILPPGRAANRQALLDQAAMFRRNCSAEDIARFLETAENHYHRRGAGARMTGGRLQGRSRSSPVPNRASAAPG